MDGFPSSVNDLLILFGLAVLFVFVVSMWILALAELLNRWRESTDRSVRRTTLAKFVLVPLTVTIFLLSVILAPVLAIVGLVLAAILLLLLYPFSLLVRSLPEILREAIKRAKILGKRLFDLDEELLSGFVRRLRDILRAILGTLGMLLVRFPPLINASMRRLQRSSSLRQDLLSDIRGFETRLQIGLAADLFLAIAMDANHTQDTRLEAVRLLKDLNRPVEDLLHIISVPGIHASIAIEAANQAVSTLSDETPAGRIQTLQVWQALAEHAQVEARLHAAEKLSELGEVDQARTLLRSLINNVSIQPNFRAQAASKLSETSLDSDTEAVEAQTPILAEAEQSLKNMANRRSARERLEGSAGMVRLGHPEFVQPIVNMLDDANLEPELHRRVLELLVELGQQDHLRFAVTKQAPTPELQLSHRRDAIQALQKVLPAEAVKHWAGYAAQPDLPYDKAKKALENLRAAFAQTPEGTASPHVQEGFSTLLELGSNENIPAVVRLAAADTLEAMDQIKEANAIYYVLQSDPKVDRRLRRKATQAVSRLSGVLLANRPGSQTSPG